MIDLQKTSAEARQVLRQLKTLFDFITSVAELGDLGAEGQAVTNQTATAKNDLAEVQKSLTETRNELESAKLSVKNAKVEAKWIVEEANKQAHKVSTESARLSQIAVNEANEKLDGLQAAIGKANADLAALRSTTDKEKSEAEDELKKVHAAINELKGRFAA